MEGLGLKYHYIKDDSESILHSYCKRINTLICAIVLYAYAVVQRASSSGKDGKTVSSLCAFCARMKRGNLYTCARNNNCNKLVLGELLGYGLLLHFFFNISNVSSHLPFNLCAAQHLDDCAESFLMSVMHNGFIRTMKANYKINAGDISVIRSVQ